MHFLALFPWKVVMMRQYCEKGIHLKANSQHKLIIAEKQWWLQKFMVKASNPIRDYFLGTHLLHELLFQSLDMWPD